MYIKRVLVVISISISVLIALLSVYYLKIYGLIELKCQINSLTGLYCPCCGLTRMVTSIIDLDFYQAFRYNPYIFIFIPEIIYLLTKILIHYIKTGEINDTIFSEREYKVLILYIVLLIVFTVLRNTETFSYLAPNKI